MNLHDHTAPHRARRRSAALAIAFAAGASLATPVIAREDPPAKPPANPITRTFGADQARQALEDVQWAKKEQIDSFFEPAPPPQIGNGPLTPAERRANDQHFHDRNRAAQARAGQFRASWEAERRPWLQQQQSLVAQYTANPSPEIAEAIIQTNGVVDAMNGIIADAGAKEAEYREAGDNLLYRLDEEAWQQLMTTRGQSPPAAPTAAPDEATAAISTAIGAAALDGLAERLDELDERLAERAAERVREELGNRLDALRELNLTSSQNRTALRRIEQRLTNHFARAIDAERTKIIDQKIAKLWEVFHGLGPVADDPRARALLQRIEDEIAWLESQKPGPAPSADDILRRFNERERRHDDERALAEHDDLHRRNGRSRYDDMTKWLQGVIDDELKRMREENRKKRQGQPAPPKGKTLTDITVNARRITITFWDHGTEDGDIIDILLNGEVVRRGITLTKAHQSIEVALRNGRNEFAVRAVNEGRISPNTATVQFTNVVQGNDVQAYQIKNDQATSMNITVSSAR